MSLLFSDNFGASWSEKPVTPNKVVLKKQVFTLINIVLRDGGIYACRATDQSRKTIQWPSNHGFFFVQSGVLIDSLRARPSSRYSQYTLQALKLCVTWFLRGQTHDRKQSGNTSNHGFVYSLITRHFWCLE